MRKMSEAEYRQFVLHGTRTAKLATVQADGRPHITPVWFLLDGDTFVFNTHESSVKARDLRRDPRVTLCVDEEVAPYSYVLVEGVATLSDDLADVQKWATRIGARYMGAERAEEFGMRNGVPGELLVRVTPSKVLAMADIAGY